ncbi:hypothetical protein, partial [Dolichospermum sp. LEGE 00246]|uniref:hypothetical protein n=1 Tax=Dolichospermum sp. LEGE 00246 TaxID=1828605 RepID=UPI00187FDCBF
DKSELDLTDNSSVEPVNEKAQKLHYILFGKTSEKIIPFSWIKASWRYIETFDCHFGFSIEDAVKYEMITIIGTPDIVIPVSIENEDLILKLIKESNPKVKIERIWVKSSKELGDFFKDRVKNDQSFEGGNVGIYAPKKA